VFDVIGWGVGLSMYLGPGRSAVSLNELTIDPESLEGLPERIARAMRANVLIEADFGFSGSGIGSGVILRVHDNQAFIVTNRHVIDHTFTDSPSEKAVDLDDIAPLRVMTVGQSTVPAKVEWIAPHGVDLAIISADIGDDLGEIREASWNLKEPPRVSDPVFAIGNPHGLGWTHSSGAISQVRTRSRGPYSFRILQSTAALNPGNSGGGLYDDQGRLIGINTLTGDHRVAEGLGFSIAIPTLMDLAPDTFDLPEANLPDAASQGGGKGVDADEPKAEASDE
jgi:serine protease Do